MTIKSGMAKMSVLLTGGRAPATLELARMLAEAGHRVSVAESQPYHLCRLSRRVAERFTLPKPSDDPEAYVAALEDIVREHRIDILIPTCEEIFYVSAGLERLSKHCTVVADSFDQLLRLHNKWTFIEAAARSGFAVPRTSLIASPEQWADAVKRYPVRDGLVMKPVYSRAAANVLIRLPGETVAPGQQAREWDEAGRSATPERPWVAQQYVEGRAICTYSVAYRGTLLAHAAYAAQYTMGKGACIYFEPLSHPAAMQWVERFVRAQGFTGQIAFDLIETPAGALLPLECNPRATSGIHLFRGTRGLDRVLLAPETHEGPPLVPRTSEGSMVGLAMLAFGLRGGAFRNGWGKWFKSFVRGKDVVFRWSDPLPFWEQVNVLRTLRSVGKRRRLSLLEAATYDIEWNGER